MTTFDKRKEGFESKFAHDEELRFKATARRNKLLGLWAAEKLAWRARRPKPMPSRSSAPISRNRAMRTFSARFAPISMRKGGRAIGPSDSPHHG